VGTLAREVVIGDGEMYTLDKARSEFDRAATGSVPLSVLGSLYPWMRCHLQCVCCRLNELAVKLMYGTTGDSAEGAAHNSEVFRSIAFGSVTNGVLDLGTVPTVRFIGRAAHDILRDFTSPADALGNNPAAIANVTAVSDLIGYDQGHFSEAVGTTVTAFRDDSLEAELSVLDMNLAAFVIHVAIVIALYFTVFRGLVQEVARKVRCFCMATLHRSQSITCMLLVGWLNRPASPMHSFFALMRMLRWWFLSSPSTS